MSLFYVTIGTDPQIEVYGGTTACDAYVNAMIGRGASAYRALTAGGDDRKRLLASASRWIDSLMWQGAADALGGTTLQFPRTGLTMPDATTATDAQQLALVSQAVFELVAAAAADPTILTAMDAGSNVQALGAGSARVSFFRPTSARDGTATVLPTVVDRLIGRWAASADPSIAAAAAGVATGVCAHSDFDPDDGDDDDDVLDVVEPL